MTLLQSIAEVEPRVIATVSLLALVAAGSSVVWNGLFHRWLNNRPLMEHHCEPRARWHGPAGLAAVYLALLFAGMSLFARMAGRPDQQASVPGLESILIFAGTALGIVVVVPPILVASGQTWAALGMSNSDVSDQVRVGVMGYFAAVIPMALSMLITLPFRGGSHQHSLLKLLMASPTWTTILAIAISAVIAAPLLEELLYRVILQGWLTTFLPATIAIPLVAGLFCLVHGWRDGLALLPLAFILGYVFHRRHSYISVVVIHALFNATMLTLQLLNPQAHS